MNEASVRRLLDQEIKSVGGQARWAATAGLAQCTVSLQITNRKLSPRVLAALGLERVVTYRRIALRNEVSRVMKGKKKP